MKANLIIVCCAMTLWGCQQEDGENTKISAFDACVLYGDQTFPEFMLCTDGRIEINPDFFDIIAVLCADLCEDGTTTQEVVEDCADSLEFTWDDTEQFCMTNSTRYSPECKKLYSDITCMESIAWD